MEPGQQNRFLDAFVATLLLNVLLFILHYVAVTVQVKKTYTGPNAPLYQHLMSAIG